MKSKKRTTCFARQNKGAWVWPITSFGLLLLSRAAEMQQAIAPPPQSSAATEPVWQQTGTNAFQVFAPAGTTPVAGLDEPFRWGPVTAQPHLLYRFFYATGLPLSPGNQQNTMVQEFSPGVLFDIGNHWTLDYTPTLRFYSNRNFKNEFNNSISLNGGTAYEDWTFGLSQSYVSSDSPDVQTGVQTSQEIYATALTASYAFNSKMSLDMGLYQNLQFTEDFQNSRDWSTMEWLNYQFWPRFNAGIGAGVGYVNVDSGPDQTYEQTSGRINWRATDKISFQINAGVEDRQFLSSGAGALLSPTFGASIQYQPFEVTQISLNANRAVTPSYFQGQVSENTSVSCDLNQRLLEKFYLDLNAAYNDTEYVASESAVSANSDNDYYTLNARLSHPFLKRGTLAIFYQYSGNSSTEPGFTYSGSQVGIEIGYKY
jgi:hypothetical protein